MKPFIVRCPDGRLYAVAAKDRNAALERATRLDINGEIAPGKDGTDLAVVDVSETIPGGILYLNDLLGMDAD